MSKEADFKSPPAVRFELTEEQAEYVLASKPAGMYSMIVGYARRGPWPDNERMTLCAWFVEVERVEEALRACGIMAAKKKQARKRAPKKTKK